MHIFTHGIENCKSVAELIFELAELLVCESLRSIPCCKPYKISLRNILTLWMISCIIRNEYVIVFLSFIIHLCAIKISVYRRMGTLMHQSFMEDVSPPIIDKAFCCFDVNQDVIISSAKAHVTIMDPHRLQISSSYMRHPTNCIAIESCVLKSSFFVKIVTIDLYLYYFCLVSELNVETPSLSHLPSWITVVPHCSLTSSFGCYLTIEDTRICICYPV